MPCSGSREGSGTRGDRFVIGVTGGAGRFGGIVARLLCERVPPNDVVVTTRSPETLDALRATGCNVRFGDFDQPASLPEAFSGIDRLLVISTDTVGDRLRQHRSAIAAAWEVGVRHVVYTSMVNPAQGHPVGAMAREHRETEAFLSSGDAAWTVLRNGFFAEGLVRAGRVAIETGRFVTNAGEGRVGWVSITDCAAVAQEVLTRPDHENKTYDVVGTELLSDGDVVQLLRDLTGRKIELVQVSDRKFADDLIRQGLPRDVADEYASFGTAIREGYVEVANDTVRLVTGKPARRVRELLTAHRSQLLD